ncbi:rhodanese-like domain-containing protein [Desulforhopalus sp. 52FAK]
MIKKAILASILSVFVAASSFAAELNDPAQILKNKITAAKQNIQTIDSKTLRNWLDADEKEFVLLDVREPGEVNAGKIEADDYLSIPRGLVEFQFTKKVKDLNKPIVVYCLKGARGVLATQSLKELGYTQVFNLDGGVLAWIEQGHPVSNFFGEFEVNNFDSNFQKKS